VERKVKEGTQGPLREEGRINGKQARKEEGARKEGSWTSEEGQLKEESRSYGAKNGIHQITIRIPLRTINF